jgi:tripartite-type tricarboxylate transporter receptor subunit TctC
MRALKLSALIVLLAAATGASAQAYPSKPVRVLVTFAAGGAVDVLGRIMAQHLSTALGQGFVVENRPGAGGLVALELAAKSPPDGYTLVVGSGGPLTISPSLFRDRGFDPVRQLDSIVWFTNTKIVMVVRSDLEAKSLAELVALSKSNPGRLTMASAGNGSILHLVGEYFQGNTGVKWTHVPYKGSAPAAADLVAKRVDVMFDALPTVLPYIKSGQIRFLASTTTTRSAQLPDGATFDELGFAGYSDIGSWSSLMAPKGTPPEIIARLNQELNRALKNPDVLARLAAMGTDPEGGAPERVTQHVASELARWGKIIQNAGLKAE